MSDLPSDWPNRERSTLIDAGGIRWHVQRGGSGPTVLFLHGTGGSTHSWAPCLEALWDEADCLAVDLPGHGFTAAADGGPLAATHFSIGGMARGVAALLQTIEWSPTLVVGHSAGVPVLLQMALDGAIAPAELLGINPALIPPPAAYMTLVAPLLGAVVEQDAVARGGAWMARGTRLIEWMLATSGSRLTTAQLARYRWLCERPDHVHAALTMMARWDLPRLLREALPLTLPLTLLAGTKDRWVPPRALARAITNLTTATLETIDGGHLLPEERPHVVVTEIRDALARATCDSAMPSSAAS